MNRENKYLAFTLVEMLIVMGIVVILMAVGIASGRFAIQRANRIEHQNAADQIYQGLQSYYTDNRQFPDEPASVSALVTTDLAEYIDEFDGGSEATYMYAVDSTNQEMLVCVSLGGVGDANQLGYYCNGNAFGSDAVGMSTAITVKDVEYGTDGTGADYVLVDGNTGGMFAVSNWDPASPW
jgi:type II secretory pathway pseudopilin PulG